MTGIMFEFCAADSGRKCRRVSLEDVWNWLMVLDESWTRSSERVEMDKKRLEIEGSLERRVGEFRNALAEQGGAREVAWQPCSASPRLRSFGTTRRDATFYPFEI